VKEIRLRSSLKDVEKIMERGRIGARADPEMAVITQDRLEQNLGQEGFMIHGVQQRLVTVAG
jgi:hypothetical protein